MGALHSNRTSLTLTKIKHVLAAAAVEHRCECTTPIVSTTHLIRQAHEVNISAYFRVKVKASLSMVQANSAFNCKGRLAEASRDLFPGRYVPVFAELGGGRHG